MVQIARCARWDGLRCNLIIEVGVQGDSQVRALEHRGFTVKHVSMEPALNVLEYWLPSQNRSPSVQWLEE